MLNNQNQKNAIGPHQWVASSLDSTLATQSPKTFCCPCKLLRLVTQRYPPWPWEPQCPPPSPRLLQSDAAVNRNTPSFKHTWGWVIQTKALQKDFSKTSKQMMYRQIWSQNILLMNTITHWWDTGLFISSTCAPHWKFLGAPAENLGAHLKTLLTFFPILTVLLVNALVIKVSKLNKCYQTLLPCKQTQVNGSIF